MPRVNWKVRIAKRAIDVVGSAVGIALTAPLYPLIAGAIYLESPGPVIFRQRRAGRLLGQDGPNGYKFEEFSMFKFRSMRPDAEKHTGPVISAVGDTRITRVGRFLRKSR